MAKVNVFYPQVPSREQTQRRRKGIALTEWWIVIFTGLAGLLFADPFFGGWLGRSFVAKGLVFGTMTVALVTNLIARATVAPVAFRASVGRVFAVYWPIVVLSLFIIVGGNWAVRIDKVIAPFTSFGLSMLFLPALAISIDCSDNPLAFLKRLAIVFSATALMMVGEMPFDKRSTHHEEIFVAVPLALVFLARARFNLLYFALGLAYVAGCGLSVKNTTYIMMALVLMVPLLIFVRRMSTFGDKYRSFVFSMMAVVFALCVVVGIGLAWYFLKSHLPHGNTEYRTEMYRIAWHKFLDSPLWGAAFTCSAVSYFGLYRVESSTQFLPTHSDILDILANGGLIGIGLWLLTVRQVPTYFWAALKALSAEPVPHNEVLWRWLMVASMINVCAIVTYAVNPPMINPLHGFWIWGSLAVSWATWRQLTKDQVPVRRRTGA